MVKWKLCLGTGLLAACCFSAGAFAAWHVEYVEAISRVYGDGEKLAAVQLRYDADLLGSSVAAADYAVPGRTVAKAFVTAEPYGKAAEKGRYVQVELTPLPLSDQMADPHPEDKHKAPIGVGGPQLGSHGNPQPLVPVTASISQKGRVETVQGRIYGGEPEMKSTHTRQPLIEKFTQHTFTDSDGKTLQYNLYVPENLEKGKTYPLVLFMHDAGTVSPEVKATLSQGRGAVTWVEPRWQEEHPCFVLAPQYDTVIVDDKYQYGPELDRTIHLVESLASQYPIDTKRIYNTGQSMGCMTSIAMDVKYPQFFAGSYLVAGKWDPRVTAPLAQQNIWAVAAAGDPGAKPAALCGRQGHPLPPRPVCSGSPSGPAGGTDDPARSPCLLPAVPGRQPPEHLAARLRYHSGQGVAFWAESGGVKNSHPRSRAWTSKSLVLFL